MKTIKGRRLAIALGAVALLGMIAASAASLGTLTSTNLGSADTIVASCDTDGLSIAYTTAYNGTTSKYEVTSVTLSGVAAPCAGQTAAVTLKATGGASIGSGSVTAASPSFSVPISPAASAEAVVGASVVISG